MILVLILCLALAFALGLFVVSPLVRAGGSSGAAAILKGFADEDELRQALRLRDALLGKLVRGRSAEETVDALGEAEALSALVNLCERLRNAELPYLPASTGAMGAGDETTTASSVASTATSKGAGLMGLALGLALAGSSLDPSVARAQANQGAEATAQPSDMRIPAPFEVEGVQFAPLHQFVLSPREGKLHVYYLAVFGNPGGATEARVGLPFPRGFGELKFQKMPEAVVEENTKAFPVVRMPLKAGVNEIRAEFTLEAATGTATWSNPSMPALPGTMLFLMPEYQSAIRNMTEDAFPSLNVWPPRIVGAPGDFRSERTKEEYDPADPNFALLVKMPPEYTRNLVRTAQSPAPYPSFEVVGIVPSRVALYVLGALFAAFLFGTAIFTMAKGGFGGRRLSNA